MGFWQKRCSGDTPHQKKHLVSQVVVNLLTGEKGVFAKQVFRLLPLDRYLR